MTAPLRCPGCSAALPADRAQTALSRFDNQTRICSDCGRREGLAQARAVGDGVDPALVLAGPGKILERR
jgi:hypothetical protein